MVKDLKQSIKQIGEMNSRKITFNRYGAVEIDVASDVMREILVKKILPNSGCDGANNGCTNSGCQ